MDSPRPLDNRVLVKIHAASQNPCDWHVMRGTPYLLRLQGGLFKPKNIHFDVNMAGVAEAVGKSVIRFKVGDEVFGGSRGGLSEFVVNSQENIAIKPSGLNFKQAAAIPMVGFTALQALPDKGRAQFSVGGSIKLALQVEVEVTACLSTFSHVLTTPGLCLWRIWGIGARTRNKYSHLIAIP